MADFFAATSRMSAAEAVKSANAGGIPSITISSKGEGVFGIWGGDGTGKFPVPKVYRGGSPVSVTTDILLVDVDNWVQVFKISGLKPGDEIFGMTANGLSRYTPALWVEAATHGPVVIFVNSMGKAETDVKHKKIMAPDAGGVQYSAMTAVSEVYKGKACVYTTKWKSDDTVTFTYSDYLSSGTKMKATKMFWDDVRNASTIIYMGHSGYLDGPILAHQETTEGYDTTPGDNYNTSQPWCAMPTFAERARKWKERTDHPERNLPDPYDPPQIDRNNLVPNAVTFWQKLGQQNGRTNDVQIILYGCDSGQSYAPVVSRIANCPVWGAMYHCSPGIWTGGDTKYNLEQMKSEREVPNKFKRFVS